MSLCWKRFKPKKEVFPKTRPFIPKVPQKLLPMACQSLWPSVPSFSVAPTVRILSRVVGATLAAFYCPRQKRELFHGWRLLFPHRLVPGSADGWSRKKPKSSTRSSAVGILVQLTILMVDTMKSPWETFGTNSFHILTMIQKGLKTCLAYFIVVICVKKMM